MCRRILPLMVLMFAIQSAPAFVEAKGPGPGPDDSVRILIARKLRHPRYDAVNALVTELVSDKNGFFHEPGFEVFFGSLKTRLVFSQQKISPGLGGVSFRAFLNKGYFEDTIY